MVPRINLHRLDAKALKRYRRYYQLPDVGPDSSRVRPQTLHLTYRMRASAGACMQVSYIVASMGYCTEAASIAEFDQTANRATLSVQHRR